MLNSCVNLMRTETVPGRGSKSRKKLRTSIFEVAFCFSFELGADMPDYLFDDEDEDSVSDSYEFDDSYDDDEDEIALGDIYALLDSSEDEISLGDIQNILDSSSSDDDDDDDDDDVNILFCQ